MLEAVQRVIGLFGPTRCMFASNAPVDQQAGGKAESLRQKGGFLVFVGWKVFRQAYKKSVLALQSDVILNF